MHFKLPRSPFHHHGTTNKRQTKIDRRFQTFDHHCRLKTPWPRRHDSIGSSVKQLLPFPALPRSPTHLVASDVTSTSVRLRWSVANGADPPVDSHVILYRRRPGPSRKHPFEEVEHFERNAEHVIASLSPHTVYEFHVVAVNNVGRSSSSNTAEVLTLESSRIAL